MSLEEEPCSPTLSRTVRAIVYHDLAPLILPDAEGSYEEVMGKATEFAEPKCPFVPKDDIESIKMEQVREGPEVPPINALRGTRFLIPHPTPKTHAAPLLPFSLSRTKFPSVTPPPHPSPSIPASTLHHPTSPPATKAASAA